MRSCAELLAERFARRAAVELPGGCAPDHGAEVGLRRGGAGEIVGDARRVVVPVGVEVLHLAQQAQRVRVVLEVDAGGLHEKEDQRAQKKGGAERHEGASRCSGHGRNSFWKPRRRGIGRTTLCCEFDYASVTRITWRLQM